MWLARLFSSKITQMFILFDLAFLLYSLAYFPYLILTKRWHPDYSQRFGFFSADVKARLRQGRNIWIHAVSVGEVVAIQGLIHQINARWPGYRMVVTVTTKTGYDLAKKQLGGIACVICSPVDISFIVRSFARRIHPQLYIAVETEIWPNLFNRLHKNKVPIAIVNGRISDKSFGRYCFIKGLLKNVLDDVRVFAMQSALDAERIMALGADSVRVHAVGNIKFDDLPRDAGSRPQDSGFAFKRPVWIAGSTHPGEEEIILKVFKKLRPLHPSWQLVLAPRHIERSSEVAALIERFGFKCARFSDLKAEHMDAQAVICVDTIGHLRGLYASASLVFVGKSLCVGGGHNVIEPAFYAKAIVIGPLMANFRDIVSCFKDKNALVQVHDAQGFESAVATLMSDEHKREALGQSARAVIDQNQGAGTRTLELLKQWL